MEILIFNSFIELAMESKTRETRISFQKLISQPETPEIISAIAKLREEYNQFMNHCYRLLKTEEQVRQSQLN